VLPAQLLQRHARLDLFDEANDLLFRVLAFSHIRHSPKLTEASEKMLVR
jgi:hypothetical protein